MSSLFFIFRTLSKFFLQLLTLVIFFCFRVVFGALPCLARLCTKDMPEDIRATAAETLAYLAEVRI